MGNRLIIVGAGGHGKVVADNALKNGYTSINYVDDHAAGTCMGFPIVGTTAAIEALNDGQTDFVMGIGNNEVRMRIAQRYDVNWVTLIHPSAQIAANVTIGSGSVIMAGAVVNACTEIGKHCIINTGAIVEHDNLIEDYVHISPGVCLSGTVTIRERTWIGVGTNVINNIEICNDVIVGAGSLVLKNIAQNGTYFGIISNKR